MRRVKDQSRRQSRGVCNGVTLTTPMDDRYEEPLLRPLLQERLRDSTRKFDTIHLVDFRCDHEL